MDNITKILADGSLVIIILLGTLLAILTLRKKGMRWIYRIIPTAIMAGLTSLCVGKFMSLIYQPAVARPFIEKGVTPGAAYIDNPGFPSDHALLATVVVWAIFFLTPYRKTSFVLMTLVIVMCIARVAALVHTPLDVTGGIVAGTAGIVWYIKIRNN